MDRELDVRTPESISFRYELAGLGSRFLALSVDQLIQIAILIAIVLGLAWAGSGLHPSRGAAASGLEKSAEATLIALVVGVIFLIFFGYFIVFEALWSGQTPGKRLLGLRVVRDGGYPIDFGASLVRNLIRVGEFVFGYYALAAISTLLSPENKRLGDIAAGTIVVRDSKRSTLTLERLEQDLAQSEIVYAATRYLDGDERALVKRFLERRDALTPQRRRELAAQIAARIRPRLPQELQALEDEVLLERL
jgi:uncharacterized RDD family membrane protein YckC